MIFIGETEAAGVSDFTIVVASLEKRFEELLTGFQEGFSRIVLQSLDFFWGKNKRSWVFRYFRHEKNTTVFVLLTSTTVSPVHQAVAHLLF